MSRIKRPAPCLDCGVIKRTSTPATYVCRPCRRFLRTQTHMPTEDHGIPNTMRPIKGNGGVIFWREPTEPTHEGVSRG